MWAGCTFCVINDVATVYISCWNTAAAVVRPKGITQNSNSLCWILKAVFSFGVSLLSAYSYPAAKSIVGKYWAFPRGPPLKISRTRFNNPKILQRFQDQKQKIFNLKSLNYGIIG